MNFLKSANINSLWAELMVEELVRNGVHYFCISPGSRSSPLACAIGSHAKTTSLIHFDERGTAFHALGYVSAKKKPCVLVCTSGTAVANLFPAVIEASKKKLPLIVLTADRPPELRCTGAMQTIDQVKIFGDYVRWQFDLPPPTREISPSFVLTTIDQAVACAQSNPPGPVHLNTMFREPLAPIKANTDFSSYLKVLNDWGKRSSPFTQYIQPKTGLHVHDVKRLTDEISEIKSGVIVAGKLSSLDEQEGALKLARKLNWPLFADIASGLRCGNPHKHIIPYYDQLLLSEHFTKKFKPDGILHLGGRITSKRFYDFIERVRPRRYLMVINHPLRNDPLHSVTLRVHNSVKVFCDAVLPRIPQRNRHPLLSFTIKANQAVHQTMDKYFYSEALSEPLTARLITRYIPKGHGLFLSNSMPIREVDMYGTWDGARIEIGANRGASGIDGIIASTAGFVAGLRKPVTLYIGDLAFLYDLNSLAMLKNLADPVVLVVANNNGGGIFSFLPVVKYKDFERYFGTPHGFEFRHAAEMFDLSYACPTKKDEFIAAYQKALKSRQSTVIEVKTDRAVNYQIHKDLQSKIIFALKKI
ncbi:MAG TPA: 2-succinyl-5-enolpyruvyl-6-hydroxy-3-cyclohexene-1-carboxylic-acid synthase [Candidatus Omnitrophica bacterium]|nr:MAG: 2-succinyl-5-enolpyruvyl-6-hydroxy-3-cyclohexene-1-carboxylic-acid synthase [Omnitrophica WOR_2 bacterium GWA2_45_18]OGX18340.1 MAG: 2-succinyl-5-enolpyruvyl-6-hydroxy-3-cyclohexene-1-carboxylic-acid synthase [Omnitrophica WOR_2 bacterium GWC2_45_7]HBR14033.1 2-succinyl-5-enolpyruvyl-6-hydroxy-3-cyclohexene-1-carboxylic-acid synthase [Candidatus Omnitrophota bacterium]